MKHDLPGDLADPRRNRRASLTANIVIGGLFLLLDIGLLVWAIVVFV